VDLASSHVSHVKRQAAREQHTVTTNAWLVIQNGFYVVNVSI
jgi:hypothetical protein